jgi:hypothetical protein
MRSSLDSRINMLRTVAKLYTDNTAKFDIVPAIKTNFTTFTNYNAAIEKALAVALADAKLAAKQAKARKLALSEAAEAVAMPTGAYAAGVGNEELKELMNVRASSLVKEKKDRLPVLCNTIFDEATKVLAEAKPYNLTEGLLNSLKAANTAYVDAADKSRLAHGLVKTGMEEIEKNIREATTLLVEQLDRLVSTLASTDAALVSLWATARKLVNPPRKVTQLLLTVLTAEDKLPIEDAKSILRNGNDYEAFTNEDGFVQFKPAPAGEVAVEVMAEGFQPFLLKKMKLKLGAENVLEVLLEKIA